MLHPGDQKNIEAVNDTYDNNKNISGYHALEEILLLITKDEKIVADIFVTLDKYKPKATLIDQLSPEIAIQLRKHVFEVTSYNPLRFVIAHTEFKQIVDASIGKRSIKSKNGAAREEEEEQEEALSYASATFALGPPGRHDAISSKRHTTSTCGTCRAEIISLVYLCGSHVQFRNQLAIETEG